MNTLFDKKATWKLFSVAEKVIARENGWKDAHSLTLESLNWYLNQ